jgi:hypothetical protein
MSGSICSSVMFEVKNFKITTRVVNKERLSAIVW